jgi:hypothetical protein
VAAHVEHGLLTETAGRRTNVVGVHDEHGLLTETVGRRTTGPAVRGVC